MSMQQNKHQPGRGQSVGFSSPTGGISLSPRGPLLTSLLSHQPGLYDRWTRNQRKQQFQSLNDIHKHIRFLTHGQFIYCT